MITIPRTHTDNIHQQANNPSSASSPFNTSLQKALCEIYGAKAAEVAPAAPLTPSPLDHPIAFIKKITGATAIAADNSNIFGKDRIDYGLVKDYLGGDRLVSASIVVNQPIGTQRPSQMFFYENLKRMGWRVYRHLSIQDKAGELSENQFVDGDVKKLVIAAADSPEIESIVLLGGDGGMTSAVKYARRAGKNVYVVAWSGTLHPALAAAATATATIEELKPLIARVLH